MSETSEITRPLVSAIERIPFCKVHRLHCGSAYGGKMQLEPAGTPDLLALLGRGDGRHAIVYFETKTPTGKLNIDQRMMHDRLRHFGYRVEVPRSFQEAIAVVKEIVGSKAQ